MILGMLYRAIQDGIARLQGKDASGEATPATGKKDENDKEMEEKKTNFSGVNTTTKEGRNMLAVNAIGFIAAFDYTGKKQSLSLSLSLVVVVVVVVFVH